MKALKNDGMLKIISLVIAIGLWIYVVQVQNPDREETLTEMKHMFLHGTGEYCNELKLIRQYWKDCLR